MQSYFYSAASVTDICPCTLDPPIYPAQVVDLGIERLNFAADAMNVVLRELRANASDGAIKLLVVR